jgi:hypothetical protein
MSDERKNEKELKDEELDKVSGGVHEDAGTHHVEAGTRRHEGEAGTHHEAGVHNK